jgi:hypothetical protein
MKLHSLLASLVLGAAALPAFGQTQFVSEAPTGIRFEQYTGASGNIVFWRLPTPGLSTFPGSACLNVSIPSDRVEQASRFLALYLFAKTNNKNIFYVFTTNTCQIVSFGMDG